MARRINLRAIRANTPYTFEEAAVALHVSIVTIRSWEKKGLSVMRTRKPFLILGSALQEFVENRIRNAKVPLEPDQLYCLPCRKPQIPMGRLVDYVPQTATTGRLVGLCPDCERTCSRMTSKAKLRDLEGMLDIAIREHGQG